MNLIRFVFAFATVAALPAGATVLECAIRPAANAGGVVTDLYVFEFDPQGDTARVVDPMIQYFYDAPIPAKMTDTTSRKFVFSWNILMTNGTGQQTKMQYRAAVIKATKAITVRATPGGGFDNSFEARGTCK